MLNFFNNLDETILLWIHHNHNTIFNQLMPFITDADNWAVPILFLFFFLGFKGEKRGKIALALLIISLSLTDSICAQILKPFFETNKFNPSIEECDGLILSKNGFNI